MKQKPSLQVGEVYALQERETGKWFAFQIIQTGKQLGEDHAVFVDLEYWGEKIPEERNLKNMSYLRLNHHAWNNEICHCWAPVKFFPSHAVLIGNMIVRPLEECRRFGNWPDGIQQKWQDKWEKLPKDQVLAFKDALGKFNEGETVIVAGKEMNKNLWGLFDDTLLYFQSDNGPSRESRNWLDGTEDPYYGGTTGVFSGHKFSLFEGGIRVPAFLCWGEKLTARTLDAPYIATDIFPTVLEACGVDASAYDLDGQSILQPLLHGENAAHGCIFWEMEDQTAVRRGKYKLVLNGRLTEGETPRAPVFLADLEADPGEKHNLADAMPDLCRELTKLALEWRSGVEQRWEDEFAKNYSTT